MTLQEKNSSPSVALVSAPWPYFNRPSIQLGILKAYLKSRFPDLNVKAFHFYLKAAEKVGYKTYQAISEKTWPSESLYASLLYPDRCDKAEEVFKKEASDKILNCKIGFKSLVTKLKGVTDNFINSINWEEFRFIAFSLCLCQLTSSLYLIKSIKKRFPAVPIVIGGSLIPTDTGRKILELFPEIDIVIIGEGELPLGQVYQHLLEHGTMDTLQGLSGIITRNNLSDCNSIHQFCQIEDLSTLPPPDYDDYFQLLKSFDSSKTFFPTLPVEISRGCWWSRKKNGCAFCNLNLQWEGYRSKTPVKVSNEIDYLSTRYKLLSVTFMDNLLPLKNDGEIFKHIERLRKDFDFFGEIRANTSHNVLKTLKFAGMKEVQVGIEALSTSLLKKMNKGTSAIQNLEIMKHCEEIGLKSNSNLIVQFPGSDEKDVNETLHVLEFARSFRPLTIVHFWLGMGSPVWKQPQSYGIKSVFNHRHYRLLFPEEIFSSMPFTTQDYEGYREKQVQLWQPIKDDIQKWEEFYEKLLKYPWSEPIISYRDGKDFLIIRQRRLEGEPFIHRLVGAGREIYLFCQHHHSLERIMKEFSSVPEKNIEAFLKMMVQKRLMFEEDEKYLSLAVRRNIRSLVS